MFDFDDALTALYTALDVTPLEAVPVWRTTGGPAAGAQSIIAIRQDYATRRPDGHWFDRDSMRFFGTRFVGSPIDVPEQECSIFMTSENPPHGDRATSVRVYNWKSADVSTFGPFAELTLYKASKLAAQLAERLRLAPVKQVTWYNPNYVGNPGGEFLTRNPVAAQRFAEEKAKEGAEVDPVRDYGPVKPVRMWVAQEEAFDPLFGAFAIWGQYPNGDRDLIAHRQTMEEAQAYIAAKGA